MWPWFLHYACWHIWSFQHLHSTMAGFFAEEFGSPICLECPRGTYQDAIGTVRAPGWGLGDRPLPYSTYNFIDLYRTIYPYWKQISRYWLRDSLGDKSLQTERYANEYMRVHVHVSYMYQCLQVGRQTGRQTDKLSWFIVMLPFGRNTWHAPSVQACLHNMITDSQMASDVRRHYMQALRAWVPYQYHGRSQVQEMSQRRDVIHQNAQSPVAFCIWLGIGKFPHPGRKVSMPGRKEVLTARNATRAATTLWKASQGMGHLALLFYRRTTDMSLALKLQGASARWHAHTHSNLNLKQVSKWNHSCNTHKCLINTWNHQKIEDMVIKICMSSVGSVERAGQAECKYCEPGSAAERLFESGKWAEEDQNNVIRK